MHHPPDTVSNYIKNLASTAQEAQVTDKHGCSLSLDDAAERVVQMILHLKTTTGKVMVIGNGGSSAIASHTQNDLCKAVGVRGIVFNEQPLLMALANDDGYDTVFEKPIVLWAESGDLLIAISSSGQSQNILRATRAAIANQCDVITLSGFSSNNPLRTMGNVNFHVASDIYGHVETAHSAIIHFLTDRAASLGRINTPPQEKRETPG